MGQRGKKAGRRRKQNTVVSLFSGAMGLDLGLESAGFSVRVGLEVNKVAIETIKANRPRLPLIEKSIRETSAEEILEKAALRKREITVLAGGPCCQSFSTAGRRRSLSDDKGSLFLEFCRVVRETRPRFFVMENVKGILSAAVKHRPLDERGPGFPPLSADECLGSALERIRAELAKLGYYVIFGLLNAADYGVPQRRWRVFFIGSRDGETVHMPRPTHCAPAQRKAKSGMRRWVTLRKALKGVRSRKWAELSKDRLHLVSRLEAGQNWSDLPVRLHRKALGGALDSWGGRTGFCRRLRWDEPPPTLTTAPDGRATMLCHPTADRPLSIEEYAVLQQFPKDWKFQGSITGQYIQIGNAVPVGLGRSIGRMLRRTMASTAQRGLTSTNYLRRGRVECADPELKEWLKNRRKTQLHPPRLRKIKDVELAREWLRASA